jgi:hypothetical protein
MMAIYLPAVKLMNLTTIKCSSSGYENFTVAAHSPPVKQSEQMPFSVLLLLRIKSDR